MNNKMIKTLSLCLCAVLTIGSIGATCYGLTNNNKDNNEAKVENKVEDQKETGEINKDETVYVIAGADGSVQKIIVSDWIKNSLKANELIDKSELTSVENVKGNETYKMNGDNMRVWDAQGNDIYYSGNIEKEIPVQMTVSYRLDGKEISPKDLAGKSGHLVMRFDYKNNQYEEVKINGKNERINVPFAMLTGMILDNKIFSNVDVSNGKIINDGNRMAVLGIALPGLSENLDINSDDIEIPDYVEISADVKNFELTTTMTLATNKLFNEIDTDKLNSIDDLTNAVGDLKSAMSQLMDGSSKLYGGLCTLLDKSSVLINGIDKLAEGANQLKNGAVTLDNGAAKLQQGASDLYKGLNTLTENNPALQGGAKKVFETLLDTANKEISKAGLKIPALTIENYSEVLNNVISSLDDTKVYNEALSQVTAGVEAKRPLIVKGVTEAVKQQVAHEVTKEVQKEVTKKVTVVVRNNVAEKVIPIATGGKMTKETYDAAVKAGLVPTTVEKAVEGAIDAQMNTDDIKNTIDQNVKAQMTSDEVKSIIVAKTEEQMNTEKVKAIISENVELKVKQTISEMMASDEVQNKLQAASEGAKTLISLKASLDSYNSFYLGLMTYTNGVQSAATGAKALKEGTTTLKGGSAELVAGVNELYKGILQIKDGTPALVSGVTELKNGSMKLSDGLKEFNERGIKKIADAVDGNLDVLMERIRATINVSKNYKSFSGKNSEMDGEVKFVYRTESIKNN